VHKRPRPCRLSSILPTFAPSSILLIMPSILVYCGSRTGNSTLYTQEAERLGELMAQHNYRLLFGGGKVGLMGVISNRILEAGGEVVGVIPEHLVAREVANPNCTELLVVKNMQERKVLMEEMADIIVTLPGGYGSMDEVFESLTNAQLELHSKPIWILNTEGFYDHLLLQVDKMVEEGFVLPTNREKLKVAATADELMAEILKQ
jgi:uncharacterized protein (TIGR00730 family)